ncbi:MAG: 23S rRNA (guanosine(2251)-2'-O)-methyltransferase RlmB [Anaeroplasma sp.]|nr:23S rRNA (guanosine(2251)-2'-O)-methyltransferase RlmB [Anaeroplasma sp.]
MIKIYGKNCVYEAIRANAKLIMVSVLDTYQKKDFKFIQMLEDKKISYEILSKDKMDKKYGFNHQGYGALREDYMLCDDSIIDSLPSFGARILILDGISDPHNLGAILRSVDAFGIDLVVLPKNRSCNINETVAHVSTGAIEHTKIMIVNSLNSFVVNLKKRGYWICGTDAKGDVLASEIDKTLNLAIIIGSEGFGMSKTLVKESDYLISIPMVGHVNSLNASVSTAIVLHDLMNKSK